MLANPYPTLAGFQAFIANVMMIDPLYLPPDAAVIGYAFDAAMSIVSEDLFLVPGGVYARAVNNLAASELINFAEDQPERTYFREKRRSLNLDQWTAGVVASTSDATSATGILNPDFMRNFTMQNLQNLKDPYGRAYLAIAQSYGPNIWGVS